jgi:hypothetical protein
MTGIFRSMKMRSGGDDGRWLSFFAVAGLDDVELPIASR